MFFGKTNKKNAVQNISEIWILQIILPPRITTYRLNDWIKMHMDIFLDQSNWITILLLEWIELLCKTLFV